MMDYPPQFELYSPCNRWGCRVVDLHHLRGIQRDHEYGHLIGRTCQTCGHQWQERMPN